MFRLVHLFLDSIPECLIERSGASDKLRPIIGRQYRAEPVIDPNPGHKKALGCLVEDALQPAGCYRAPEWAGEKPSETQLSSASWPV